MNKVILICPYFGSLPTYFPFVLKSMQYNKTIDWMIITDCQCHQFDVPNNVHIMQMTFNQLNMRIRATFPYKIDLTRPYKLCDFRPFFGLIFKDYIRDYIFWGHCDIDCIFGDIRKFIPFDLFDKYDKLLYLGHLSLYRNCERIDQVLMQFAQKKGIQAALMSNNYSYQLDELWVIAYLIKTNIKMNLLNDNESIADLLITKKKFYAMRDHFSIVHRPSIYSDRILQKEAIFSFCSGTLQGYSVESGHLIPREYMYVHMQKRIMKCHTEAADRFLIVPNSFEEYTTVNQALLQHINAQSDFYPHGFILRVRNKIVQVKQCCHDLIQNGGRLVEF